MQDITMTADTLTLAAFSDLQQFFREKDHSPNAEMMEGLYNTIDNLTLQLHGKLDPMYYICALDPGVGKTSAIKAWIRNYLKRAHEYDRKGVVLFFDRHEEISSFLDECDLPADSYAVLVGDATAVGKSLNARGIGKDNAGDALVLFTTKQQIIRRAHKTKSFQGVEVFHYQGEPRVVRIWDESMQVGRELTVNASDVLELVGTIERRGEMELGAQIRGFALELYGCGDSDLVEILDFDLELRSGFRWETPTMRKTAEMLDMLAGRVAEVKVEGKGRVVLDCIESLPEDLQPCLVTDASARFRGTYALYEEYQGRIQRLAPEHSCKTFAPLTVHILHRSTSKQTYSNPKEIEKVAADVAEVVMSRPGEDFLVVVTVSNYKRLSKEIQEQLPKKEHGRVRFLTWGRHTATNKFIDIPNVIITSLLYYRPADYVASMRASAVYPAAQGMMPKEYFRGFQRGEIGHHIGQAANRGKMRKCVGGMCPDSRLWIMGAKSIGVESIVAEVFPGCTVREWKSVAPKEIGGIKEQVRSYISAEFRTGKEFVSWSSVRKAFGIKDQSNFRKTFLKDDAFLSSCGDVGIMINFQNYSFIRSAFFAEGGTDL